MRVHTHCNVDLCKLIHIHPYFTSAYSAAGRADSQLMVKRGRSFGSIGSMSFARWTSRDTFLKLPVIEAKSLPAHDMRFGAGTSFSGAFCKQVPQTLSKV